MAKNDEKKPEDQAAAEAAAKAAEDQAKAEAEAKIKADAEAKAADEMRSKGDEAKAKEGLIKMHKDGKEIHAHRSTVKHHEGNGWKVA